MLLTHGLITFLSTIPLSGGPFRKICFHFIAHFLFLIGRENKVALTLSATLKSKWTPHSQRARECFVTRHSCRLCFDKLQFLQSKSFCPTTQGCSEESIVLFPSSQHSVSTGGQRIQLPNVPLPLAALPCPGDKSFSRWGGRGRVVFRSV